MEKLTKERSLPFQEIKTDKKRKKIDRKWRKNPENFPVLENGQLHFDRKYGILQTVCNQMKTKEDAYVRITQH